MQRESFSRESGCGVRGCALVFVLACASLLFGYYFLRQTWLDVPSDSRYPTPCPFIRGDRRALDSEVQAVAFLKEHGVDASVTISLSGEYSCDEFLSSKTTLHFGLRGASLATPAQREHIRRIVQDFAAAFAPYAGTSLMLRFAEPGVPAEHWLYSYDLSRKTYVWVLQAG